MDKNRLFIENNSEAGLRMGSKSNLIRDYAEPMLQTIIDEIKIQQQLFPEYKLSIDGTPSFEESECIIIYFVTKKFKILELVVRIGLLKTHLTHEDLTNHILHYINKNQQLPYQIG